MSENRISYEAIKIDEGFWSIEENGVRCFLIEGDGRAMLVDTGFGTGDIKAFVQKLTKLPIFLVNTHADGDHLGCNGMFDEVYMSPCEFDYYAAGGRDSSVLRPLWEGEIIDLGTRKFEVISIPGHTPGSIALLDSDNRLLISGDSVQSGAIFMFGSGRNIDAYIYSMEKLEKLCDRFDRVLPSHGEMPVLPSIIPKLVEGAKALREGKLGDGTVFRENMPCKAYDCGVAKFLF